MKFAIKPVCFKKDIRRDGTSLIFIQYCYSAEKKVLLNTEIAIPPKFWNSKQLAISDDLEPEFGSAHELNDELVKMMRIAEDILSFSVRRSWPDIPGFLKETFKPSFDPKTLPDIEKEKDGKNPKLNLDLYFQIDDYIRSQTKKVCADMPRIYRNMKYHLKEFEAFRGYPITFDGLDFNFYEDFVDFLTHEYVQDRRKIRIVGLKVNTIGKTIKQFRTFLRNRIRKRIIPPIDMNGWTILEEEVDAVYLPTEEIKLIQELDLSSYPQLEDYRNDFVLGCLTGLRFSDFSKLDENDLRGDLLYKKQMKSDRWVVVPLRKEAVIILNNRIKNDVPAPSNAEFNRHIKTIAKLAGITQLVKHSYKKSNKDVIEVKPKYAWVTSHTCRRSFCTNEFLAGTPVELIMKISGHKSVKDFYKYIRITPEEAANKIKAIWQEREGQRSGILIKAS